METTIEQAFQDACATRMIPGAVLLAADKSGNFNYTKSFGVRSLQGDLSNEPLTADSILWFASCTKLLTSISALQCVERGLISLDDDVRNILQELKGIAILHGNGETGTLESSPQNTTPITLRHLLTHSAGFVYPVTSPLLREWRKQQPEMDNLSRRSVMARYTQPLLYEPGTSWSYGPSTDWAGVLVERLTNTNLQDYMIKNIWEPLEITDMTFFMSTRPDLQARIAHMSSRDEGGPTPTCSYAEQQPSLDPDMVTAQGGIGIYTCPREYFKVLRALLMASEVNLDSDAAVPPGQLLRPSTIDMMFSPQLNQSSAAAFQAISETPLFNRTMAGMPPGTRKDYGLGGVLVEDDLPGWWRQGTMMWCGFPNLTWWIDRGTGLCGLYSGQLEPVADAKTVEMLQLFIKDVYRKFEEHNSFR